MRNTDLVQKQQQEKAVSINHNVSEFFDENVVSDKNDILIPRLLLMHGTSALVGQQKAHQGDIVDSVSQEVLANSKKPIEIIPIKQLDKVWNIEVWNGKKYEFERTDPWDESLAKEWEFVGTDGRKRRRNARLSFYVLLARDSKTSHLPYLIAFQRTSYKAGKNIASFFNEALFAFRKGDRNSIPMNQVFELSCRVEQGDNGAYFVLDCKRTRLASEEEREKAKYWFTQLRTSNYKVDEEKETASETASSGVEEF